MSVKGSIETMPCRDVLDWISKNKKSGSLQIHRGNIAKDIFVQNGQVISSGSNDPQEFLGQFFISFGKLSEDDLVKAYQVQRETKVYLGKILVMIGKVSEAQVQKVLTHKTRETILDCFLWEHGTFAFIDNKEPLPGQSISVAIDIPPIILEGDQRKTEWAEIRRVIVDLEGPITLNKQNFPPGFPEKPDDQKLIRILESGKRIPDICYEFHMSPFLVGKKIHHLAQQGIVSVGKAKSQVALKSDTIEMDPLLIQELTSKMNDESVPRIAVDMNQLSRAKLDAQEGYVVSRINGVWCVGEIVQICPFAREKVLAVIARLAKEKFIDWVK